MPIVPEALGWLDARKRATWKELQDAYSNAGAGGVLKSLGGMGLDVAKGVAVGGAGMVGQAADIVNPSRVMLNEPSFSEGATKLMREALDAPEGGGAETAGEFLGPPMKAAAKVAALAKAALPTKLGALATFLPAWPEQIKKAELLKKLGKTPDDIWMEAQTEHLPGSGWVREVSDSNMTMKPNPPNFTGLLSDFIDHPELAQDPVGRNYLNTKVMVKPKGQGPSYSRPTKTMSLPAESPEPRHDVVHELGHAVQHGEGWVGGASHREQVDKVMSHAIGDPDPQYIADAFQQLPAEFIDAVHYTGHRNYGQVSGEMQARAAENRKDWTDAQRANTRPGATADPWMKGLFDNAKRAGVDLTMKDPIAAKHLQDILDAFASAGPPP